MKCDNCNKTATVHLTEIKSGKKIEKHLCEQCAAQNEGLPVKSHMPINELLTNFVMAHSGMQKEQALTCEHCGIDLGGVPAERAARLRARLHRVRERPDAAAPAGPRGRRRITSAKCRPAGAAPACRSSGRST